MGTAVSDDGKRRKKQKKRDKKIKAESHTGTAQGGVKDPRGHVSRHGREELVVDLARDLEHDFLAAKPGFHKPAQKVDCFVVCMEHFVERRLELAAGTDGGVHQQRQLVTVPERPQEVEQVVSRASAFLGQILVEHALFGAAQCRSCNRHFQQG